VYVSEVYLTKTGYSQSYPFKVVGQSASGKTLHLKPVKVARDPEWQPEMHPGGFAAHCSNQSDQTWLYDGVEDDAPVTKVRLKKSRYGGSDLLWGSKYSEFIAGGAVYFYDYNFCLHRPGQRLGGGILRHERQPDR